MTPNDEILQQFLKHIQDANNKQTEELKTYMNKELKNITESINTEIQKRNELEENYQELKNKYKILEKSLRKNNIVIFGLQCIEENLLEYTIEQLNNHLDLTLTENDVNNIYMLGKQAENIPIKIEFTRYLQKQNVLRNCFKLKNTDIRIHEDLSIEERAEKRILVQHLKEARSKNKTAYIKGNKLCVSDNVYTVEELMHSNEEKTVEIEKNINSKSNSLDTPQNKDNIETNKKNSERNPPEHGNEKKEAIEEQNQKLLKNQPKRRRVYTTAT